MSRTSPPTARPSTFLRARCGSLRAVVASRIAYAGLSLRCPSASCSGIDWTASTATGAEPVAGREAVYTNLTPGPTLPRHRVQRRRPLDQRRSVGSLRRRADALADGWFRLSAVLLSVLAGWGVFRLRVFHVARQLNMRFEERLAERTRIAQELHDTLLQGFISASMQLHVATDRLPADSPVKPSLGRVLEPDGAVIEEGRKAVRGCGRHAVPRTISSRPSPAFRGAGGGSRPTTGSSSRAAQASASAGPRRGLPDWP